MNKLWKRNIVDRDPEPLFSPENVPVYSFNVKAAKRSSVSLPAQQVKHDVLLVFPPLRRKRTRKISPIYYSPPIT